MPRCFRLFILCLSGLLLAVPAAHAATRIDFAHHLQGGQAQQLQQIVARFNATQKAVEVRLLDAAPATGGAHLNLLTTGELASLSARLVRFKPLHEVMREAREKFDAGGLSPDLRASVSDTRGRLLALPMALTTPVLYYNKAAFVYAGLDPERPPRTWFEVQTMAGRLLDAGLACPYTTSWPAWVHIDNAAARNGGDTIDEQGRPLFNGYMQVKHVALLASWYRSRYFTYFGPADEADRRFAAGECGMLTSSSALTVMLRDAPALDVGVASLPYHEDAWGGPKSATADGASLWVAAGRKADEYKAVARFIQFLLGVEVQNEMTVAGGFLPMTPMARESLRGRLLKIDRAGLDVAYAQLQSKQVQRGLRISQFEAVRSIVDEELEAVWADRKPAKEALDHAAARAASILPALIRSAPL